MSPRNKSKKITEDHIQHFSFKGYQTMAKVIVVYDGKTLDLVFEHHEELVRYKCRLVNTVSPPGINHKSGKIVRNLLALLSTGKDFNNIKRKTLREMTKGKIRRLLEENQHLVEASFGSFDKYGRPYVTIKNAGRCVNDIVDNFVNNLDE